MRWVPLLAVVLLGCASAGSGGNNPDGNPGGDGTITPDGAIEIDAPVDAAPISKTLTQSQGTGLVATQIGCQQTNPLTGFARENSYYRVFPLVDFAIPAPFTITQVTVPVETATSATAAAQPVQIKLGTYAGTIGAATLNPAQISPLASASMQVPNGTTSIVAPIAMFTPATVTVPADANLVVEVFIPDGVTAQNTFFIGSNNAGETRPSYIRAPACNFANPTTYATVGQPQIQLLLSVTGTY